MGDSTNSALQQLRQYTNSHSRKPNRRAAWRRNAAVSAAKFAVRRSRWGSGPALHWKAIMRRLTLSRLPCCLPQPPAAQAVAHSASRSARRACLRLPYRSQGPLALLCVSGAVSQGRRPARAPFRSGVCGDLYPRCRRRWAVRGPGGAELCQAALRGEADSGDGAVRQHDLGQPGPLRPAGRRLLHAQLCSHDRVQRARPVFCHLRPVWRVWTSGTSASGWTRWPAAPRRRTSSIWS